MVQNIETDLEKIQELARQKYERLKSKLWHRSKIDESI